MDIYANVASNKKDFEEKWKVMTKYTLEAINLLENTKDGFGVVEPKELPFEPMIPVLASLLKEVESKFKDTQKKCFEKLENWYWCSVFSVAYSSAVDSTKTSDFREMMEWFSNDKLIPKSIRKMRSDYNILLDLKSVEQQTNAIYKGVLCLIAIKGGNDFDKNRSITNKKYHKDHIFPRSSFSNYENINSILNMTWLTTDTNQRIKKARSPSTFLKETIHDKYDQDEKAFLKTLESHFINYEAYQYMKENNFEKFIETREKIILDVIGQKIGA